MSNQSRREALRAQQRAQAEAARKKRIITVAAVVIGLVVLLGGGGFLIFSNRDSIGAKSDVCLLYTSPSPRDRTRSRMPSSA